MQCALQTLFEVDGTNVYRESLDVVAQLLLGEPGTQVRLLFLRGTRLFIEANIERQRISRQVLLLSLCHAQVCIVSCFAIYPGGAFDTWML